MTLKYSEIRIANRKLLHSGSIACKRGEVVLIQGKNGAGKTLLLKNIFCHLENTRYAMAFVDQHNNGVSSNMDILHNISMKSDDEYNETIRKKLCYLGYGELLKHDVTKLSGGEKRLVCILRGLFSGSDILILDEPTNDLDYQHVEMLIELLKNLGQNMGLIIVSHDDRICKLAHRIYTISNQQIITEQSESKLTSEQETESKDVSCSVRELDLKILRAVFRYNYIPTILAAVFLMFVFIQMLDYHRNTRSIMDLPTNQINLYLPISIEMGGDIMESLPAISIQMMNMGISNPVKQLDGLKTIESLLKDSTGRLDALDSLKSDEMITVYPVEFFNPIENHSSFTEDLYLQTFHGVTQEEAILDTSGYFEKAHHQYEVDSYPFDRNLFEQIVAEIKKNPSNHVVAVSVVLNDGFSSEDFFNSESFEVLLNSHTFVGSRDASVYVASLRDLQDIVRSSRIILLVGFFILLIDVLSMILFGKNQIGKINIVKNYGYPIESVQENVIQKCNIRSPQIVLLILFIICNAIVFAKEPFSQTLFVFSLYAVLYLTFLHWVNNTIFARIIQLAFRWNAR